jgi:hypothetical protein
MAKIARLDPIRVPPVDLDPIAHDADHHHVTLDQPSAWFGKHLLLPPRNGAVVTVDEHDHDAVLPEVGAQRTLVGSNHG